MSRYSRLWRQAATEAGAANVISRRSCRSRYCWRRGLLPTLARLMLVTENMFGDILNDEAARPTVHGAAAGVITIWRSWTCMNSSTGRRQTSRARIANPARTIPRFALMLAETAWLEREAVAD